ncbi:MAG TPA: nucleotidyl transferase AbiEii/AbiGii toxin family protein [Kiritimatiellia bacterium]|nr:nucleotidyl transferase AbiEii/AbiGii toxin family protein [Kiritimatiellia bacterium]HMO98329.1 nucleotidyl transferase AbiEii/AbiGii toxin family protein [Kiritimatiellia bacterium]HMP95475.1 nucleotidyl transferase AbiEii/AbiGii toxin family protein [Kiritimatiellia bacterium]
MPLTSFQKEVLTILRDNRSERSHFAGGLVLNAPDDSSRFSHDFDIFRESAEDVVRCSQRDVESLRQAGFEIDLLARTNEWDPGKLVTFRKARVRKAGQHVEIDWAADSAFRFFPIVPDEQLGWRLHLFDMAVNKAHALAARTETRDYIDIVELCREYPLAAICWAAPGKDPGYSPLYLLKMMRRFAKIDPAKMEEIQARQLDPIALKMEWMEMSDKAEADMIRQADEFPRTPIGVAFVDKDGHPGWIGDNPTLRPHPPCIRGCWPVVHLDAAEPPPA